MSVQVRPEKVSFDNDESLHEFLDGEAEGNTYRRAATPKETEYAEACLKYLESENPHEEFPDLSSDLLAEALDDECKDHELSNVTEYSIRGYGSLDEIISFGVEYTIGNNFESEVKSQSKQGSSTGF